MPHIRFTDTNLARLGADKTTWFTDPDVKGLQLCVTPGGTKTWYVNRWDSKAQKTRRVKLGQWASKGSHCAWAKKQVGKVAHDIDEGKAATKAEAAAARAGIPTFREALDEYLTHRQSKRASGKARMLETTAHDYRLSFDKHLVKWADVQVDQLPILEINRHLNALQITRTRHTGRPPSQAQSSGSSTSWSPSRCRSLGCSTRPR